MNAFQWRNFKLDDPIEQQGVSCYEQDETGRRDQCDIKPITALERPNHLTMINFPFTSWYISVNVESNQK